MAIDMFETRTMLRILEETFPPKTFLLDTFFREVETSQTEHVDIDVVVGKRRLAPFVRPQSQAKQVERRGYEAKSFKPPYIKMKMVTTAEDILQRMAGNTIYQGNSSPAERASMQLGKDLAEMQEMIVRREEWMASQALEDGVIAINGDDITAEMDFGFHADHSPTAATLWDDDTSDPIEDLRIWSRLITRDSGLVPDACVMGIDTLDAFLDNIKVRQNLDTRRIDLGKIDPQGLPSGALYIGTIKGMQTLDIYSYDEYWADDAGDLQPMVPPKKLFMGSTRARAARHYGAIRDLDAGGNFAVQFFAKSWKENDPSARILMVQSAPLVCPHQINAFLTAETLA